MADSFRVTWDITKTSADGKADEKSTYRVSPIPFDPATHKRAWRFVKLVAKAVEGGGTEMVPSKQGYEVRQLPDGFWECGCLGHSRWGRCKHVRTVKRFLGEGFEKPKEVPPTASQGGSTTTPGTPGSVVGNVACEPLPAIAV